MDEIINLERELQVGEKNTNTPENWQQIWTVHKKEIQIISKHMGKFQHSKHPRNVK